MRSVSRQRQQYLAEFIHVSQLTALTRKALLLQRLTQQPPRSHWLLFANASRSGLFMRVLPAKEGFVPIGQANALGYFVPGLSSFDVSLEWMALMGDAANLGHRSAFRAGHPSLS